MIGVGGEVKCSHLIGDRLEELYTPGPDMEKPGTNVENIKRMKRLLMVAIEFSLTDRQRQIIQMRYIEEKDAVEIARELGVGTRAVYKTIQVARKKLEKVKIFLKM